MTLPDVEEHALRFAHARSARRTKMQEDYVELIAALIAEHGEARATDLAKRFGVSPATVSDKLNRLKRDGLVEARPYRSLFLTPEGRSMAVRSRERHDLVVLFLLSLGVSNKTAKTDAKGLEHHLSQETLDAMSTFAAPMHAGEVDKMLRKAGELKVFSSPAANSSLASKGVA